MARTTVAVKKLKFTNPYPRLARTYEKNAKALPKAEAAFTWRRARSIMKKGPKRPKTMYGNIQAYGQKVRNRRQAQGKPLFFWRKGAYSRPGHPPFHYGKNFDLRFIIFSPISPGSVHIPKQRKKVSGAAEYAWRVGPKYDPGLNIVRGSNPPVPGLHEYGGKVKLVNRGATYAMRGHDTIRLRRRSGGTGWAMYPARPYMRPAAKEARESVQKKMGSYKRLVRLFGPRGIKGQRRY